MAASCDYQFVSGSPPEDYVCAICTFVAHDPHQITCCGGLFCKDCLQNVEDSYEALVCPLCRRSVTDSKKYFKDWRAERKIKNLEIYCTNRSIGCTWDGKMADIGKHLENCGYETIKCANCEEELLRKHLNRHLADLCQEREILCPNCKVVGKYGFITSDGHISECPGVTVSCPNEGCDKDMSKKMLDSHSKVCPKAIVSCTYAVVGCSVTMTRETAVEHERHFTQEHLQMAMEHIQQQDDKIEHQYATIKEQHATIQEQHAKIVSTSKNQCTLLPICPETHKVTCTFPLNQFQAARNKKQDYYTKHFYTIRFGHGYKMAAKITFSTSHLGFYIYLLQGDDDSSLEWPFRAVATVELLNQIVDKDHFKSFIVFDEKVSNEVRQRPISRSNHPLGIKKFFPYSNLSRYLLNDTLTFRVTVDVQSKLKPWLEPSSIF